MSTNPSSPSRRERGGYTGAGRLTISTPTSTHGFPGKTSDEPGKPSECPVGCRGEAPGTWLLPAPTIDDDVPAGPPLGPSPDPDLLPETCGLASVPPTALMATGPGGLTGVDPANLGVGEDSLAAGATLTSGTVGGSERSGGGSGDAVAVPVSAPTGLVNGGGSDLACATTGGEPSFSGCSAPPPPFLATGTSSKARTGTGFALRGRRGSIGTNVTWIARSV